MLRWRRASMPISLGGMTITIGMSTCAARCRSARRRRPSRTRSISTNPGNVNFLFYSEVRERRQRRAQPPSFEPLIADRKAYFNHWNTRLEEMPIVLGTPPQTIADPVVIEIFGITDEFLARMKQAPRTPQNCPASRLRRVSRAAPPVSFARPTNCICFGRESFGLRWHHADLDAGLHQNFRLRLRRRRHAHSRLGGQPRIPRAVRRRDRIGNDDDQERR